MRTVPGVLSSDLLILSIVVAITVGSVEVMGIALVVEDSLTDMQILMRCLKRGGINVLTAQSGEEAIRIIAQQKPDVVVLDIILPGCSGFEICRRLRAEASTRDISIVICSTKGTEADKFWGIKQGADAYLPKPIDQAELVRTVKELMGH
jgi:DNA-binding response OmpR family regulator